MLCRVLVRTLVIILGIFAVIALAVILIAPDLELDDYSDHPFYNLLVLLLSFLLQFFCTCNWLRLLSVALRRRRAHIPWDRRLGSTLVKAAPQLLLC